MTPPIKAKLSIKDIVVGKRYYVAVSGDGYSAAIEGTVISVDDFAVTFSNNFTFNTRQILGHTVTIEKMREILPEATGSIVRAKRSSVKPSLWWRIGPDRWHDSTRTSLRDYDLSENFEVIFDGKDIPPYVES